MADPLHLEARRREIATELGTMSTIDVGSGPTALFIHGVATNAHLWRNVIDLVSPTRRCVAVDLPGHGQTPFDRSRPLSLRSIAALIDATCAEMGLDRIDVVANDTGGAIAQALVVTAPDRVASLTLTNCETHDNIPPRAVKPAAWAARIGLLQWISPPLLKDLGRARRRMFGQGYQDLDALPLEVVRSFLEPVIGNRDRVRDFQRYLLDLGPTELLAIEGQLRSIPTPTLIVWGDDDPFFATTWATRLRDTLPNVIDLVEVRGGRLFFPDERAPDLVSELSRMWNEISS